MYEKYIKKFPTQRFKSTFGGEYTVESISKGSKVVSIVRFSTKDVLAG
jgi:hypothetical protein